MSGRHSRISWKGKNPYTKIYFLTLLYTTKLEEGFLDVDGNVKSMEAI
jgi:hypothetical protein